MFSRKALTLARVVAVMAFSSGSLGCWEQVSEEWFPQMKRQPAVQAFEANATVGAGPFGVVIPIGGHFSLANAFSDGHIYTTITMGRGRMPSYKRIPVSGRWDLINYIRVLNDRGERQ